MLLYILQKRKLNERCIFWRHIVTHYFRTHRYSD